MTPGQSRTARLSSATFWDYAYLPLVLLVMATCWLAVLLLISRGLSLLAE